jgi:hypothetical protein
MGRDGQDREIAFRRPVAPEDALRPRSFVLHVGFPDLFGVGIWTVHLAIGVRLQTGMLGILPQQLDRFMDLLEESFCFRGFALSRFPAADQRILRLLSQFFVLFLGFNRPLHLKYHLFAPPLLPLKTINPQTLPTGSEE